MNFQSLLFKNTKYVTNTLRFKTNWLKPEGYDTSIKVFNCIAREKVPFIVRNKNNVSWYTCGPTVYDSAHIGHASCYVKLDIIQRILKTYFNLKIVTAMNITDIDDKIINRSKTSNISVTELTQKYEEEFMDDLSFLNVCKPDIVLRVTQYIPRILDFIKKLLETNKAYVSSKDKSVYFSLDNYDLYGKLQNISETENKSASRDFALWKAAKPGEPFWESEWGPGRPGWHIECSAMAGSIFGSKIDVHAGGIDLRYPHHENEEAQSCAHYNTTQWVNYWFHTGHLHLSNDEKMSKSLKNTISIQELSKNTSSDVFRMTCAMSHYRNNLEYSSDVLNTAESYVNKIKSFINDCESYVKGYIPKANINEFELVSKMEQSNNQIFESLKDDFNTAKVIKIIIDLISTTNKMLKMPSTDQSSSDNKGVIILASKFVQNHLCSFGFEFLEDRKIHSEMENVDKILDIFNEFRQNVRNYALDSKNKDLLKLCDHVRNNLRDKKINIQDFGKVSSWNRI